MNGGRLVLVASLMVSCAARADDVGNRLARLNAPVDPYPVSAATARLVTPQWVGQEGVRAVIVLAVDDMSETPRYEAFLRPILDRLKQIDGRAPLSIMTKSIDPALPQLRAWMEEGVSIEAHTQDHPCPCLQGGSLAPAKETFDRCVDQLARIPQGQPVAFRMPCCDSMNSVSPRFFAEIWNRTTPAGRYLSLDSSVFMLFTANDPQLPRSLVFDADSREKFRKYVPADRWMCNYVEDYPYPYVIDRLCWEFPSLMPSDWDAQQLNGKCSPETVRDLKAAVDATVIKQGVFSLCFHPHGWIDQQQVVEWIDDAVARHGKQLLFLNFREVLARLTAHLLDGHPLRDAAGGDNGVRLCDVNHDGFLDVLIGNDRVRVTRVWRPDTAGWSTTDLPVPLVRAGPGGASVSTGVQFGVLQENGFASLLVSSETARGLWHFDGARWVRDASGLQGLDPPPSFATQRDGRDAGLRLLDLDRDGHCELIVGNARQRGVYAWTGSGWQPLPFSLPGQTQIVDAAGRDAGLRFVDFDQDGQLDLLFSNARRCAVYRFTSRSAGWSDRLFDAPREGPADALPMIVRADGTNNGAWFKDGYLWVQNEDTGKRQPQHVLRRSGANSFR